jgi:hypothetical protein
MRTTGRHLLDSVLCENQHLGVGAQHVSHVLSIPSDGGT